jgi:hypothetical protein
MHAAGAAGTVVALGDCTYDTSYIPLYGIACTPDVCAPIEQESGADSTTGADASVDSPEAGEEDAGDAAVTEASAGEAAADAPSDAPDGR